MTDDRFSSSRCRTCSNLRWFLTAAAALIVAIYLQPGWAVRVTQLLPSSLAIGLGICGIGSLGFALRLWRMHQPDNS